MKKILFLALAAFAMAACEKNPDMGELSGDYLVYTTYNPSQFPVAAGTKVFVPDYINDMTQSGTETEWNDGDAPTIIEMFVEQLEDCGYDVLRPGDDLTGVAMNLSLSYVRDISYYVDYPYYWWWDYWDYGYWPYWYYPYPYAYVFEYSVASLTAELLAPGDLSYVNDDPSNFPVYWNAFIGGYDYGSKAGNAPSIEKGIPRAFSQSPYLKTTAGPV